MQPESSNIANALAGLLASLEAGNGKAVFHYDVVLQWGLDAAEALLGYGLIQPALSAQKIECLGCEERCYSDVVLLGQGTDRLRAFVVCEVPHKQAEMGRVPVQLVRLQQWSSDMSMLARFVAAKLGLDAAKTEVAKAGVVRLGMMPSPSGRRWASLVPFPLSLEINLQNVLLNELLFACDGEIRLDDLRIRAMLANELEASEKVYTPNTDRRESRRQETQAMYQNWLDAYAELVKQHPNREKTWYAQKIARMDAAQGRDAETIRKRLH